MFCEGNASMPRSPAGEIFTVVHGLVDAIMLLLITLANSIIIFAIRKYQRRQTTLGLTCRNHPSIYLVLSLASSDILVAVSTAYYLIFEYSCTVFRELGSRQDTCVARFVFCMAAVMTSFYSLIVLAVDRYIAVVHALQYNQYMTIKVAKIMIALVWSCGFLTGITLIFWNNWTPTTYCKEYLVIPTLFFPFINVTVLISTIIVLSILHWRIHEQARIRAEDSSIRSTELRAVPRHRFSVKSLRVMFLIVGCVVVLWTPIVGISLARGQGLNSPNLNLAYGLAFSFYDLVYLANTFIYSWMNKSIRNAILLVLRNQ